MSPGLRRGLAKLTCSILQRMVSGGLQAWGWAIRHEVDEIADDTEALLFALNSLAGIAPRVLAFYLFQPFVALAGDVTLSSGGSITMGIYADAVRRPRSLGIACAVGAVILGLVYMAVAGAPMRYLGINAGALVIGLVMLVLVGRLTLDARRWPGVMTMMIAIGLLATALFGDQAEGVARWIKLGPLFIQPSLILLPVVTIGFARLRNAFSTGAMMIAAVALAIQPDRAMAGMLAAGMAVLAITRPDRHAILAFVSSITGFAATLLRPDTLGAMPYVDQILYSSFSVHALAGLAVLGGSVLLIIPAIVGKLYDADHGEVYSVFGAVWLAAIIAAALGNYPTPIVGYGGSAILGYVLSLTMLPTVTSSCFGAQITVHSEASDGVSSNRTLCVGLAYSG